MNIIRGGHQIGGSIIEITSATTRLMLDVGMNLDEPYPPTVPEVEGVFCGAPRCDGVLISHYHSDHTGLLPYLLPGIPIYMADKMFRIYKASAERFGHTVEFEPVIFNAGGQKADGHYSFTVGDISVTPFLCDHSAFDSYMYLLESGGETILYTGDFRANGRKSFYSLLKRLPEKVDKLIVEGTTVTRETIEERNATEYSVESAFAKLFAGTEPIFVLASTTNFDRIVSVYKACLRTKRCLLMDGYQASLLEIPGGGMPRPSKHTGMRVIRTDRPIPTMKQPFVMLVRSSDAMRECLARFITDTKASTTLVYSMWRGYEERTHTKEFMDFCRSAGMKIAYLHTSGHADATTLCRIAARVNPDEIYPVHTEDPDKLLQLLKNT